MHNTCIY